MTVVDDGKVVVWDLHTRTEAAVLAGPGGGIQNAQVSPDGTTLYTSAVGGVLLA
ncbi:MAG: hypothetical protein JO262_10690 [Solirubrobacterales bacterium]|nr:hypothetical protein [Solirubrobacterales bacterium]